MTEMTRRAQNAIGLALQPVLAMLQSHQLDAANVSDALMEIAAALVYPFGKEMYLEAADNAFERLDATIKAREEAAKPLIIVP